MLNVLMTKHAHLLLTAETADGIAKLMQSVGRRFLAFVRACKQSSSLRCSNTPELTFQQIGSEFLLHLVEHSTWVKQCQA
jgi:hypothetical protein